MNSEEILVALAIKHDGDWDKIMKSLKQDRLRKMDLLDEKEEVDTIKELEQYYEIAKNASYKYTTLLSKDYPELLKALYKPPFVLFYFGDLSLARDCGRNVSVVGSRHCSEYGVNMTNKIVQEIANQYNIVSGLAAGIDTIAHQTAIDVGGKTIAILGGGIEYCYPSSNLMLYEEIKRFHLVMSEYPGKLIPDYYKFPRRNRIIAALSRGTIVTEAYARSGSLYTVGYALETNRLVMCVPYPADCESECNRLIAGGAYLIENGKDALEILDTEIHL